MTDQLTVIMQDTENVLDAARTLATDVRAFMGGDPPPPPPVAGARSKLGIHADNTGSDLLPDILAQVTLAQVNIGFDIQRGARVVGEALLANPDLRVILRCTHPQDAESKWLWPGAPDGISQWWAYQKEWYDILKGMGVDLSRVYPKSSNELSTPANPLTDDIKVERIQTLSRWDDALIPFLADKGLGAVGGFFSPGMPEIVAAGHSWEEGVWDPDVHWGHYSGALEELHNHKGLLVKHEYFAPFMWHDGFGKTVPTDEWSPDIPGLTIEPWFVGRFLADWEHAMVPMGFTDIEIVVAELAYTTVMDDGRGYLSQHNGLTPAQYIAQLQWIDEHLYQPYDFVAGGLPYIFGSQAPDIWKTYELNYPGWVIPYLAYLAGTVEG